jgi:hypothetical protein
VLHEVPVLGVDLEQVPVERSVRGPAHGCHHVEDLVGEAADGGDELECRAGVVPHHGAQRQQLLPTGVARRDRRSGVVVVAGRPRGGEAETARGQSVVEERLHPGQLVRRGLALSGRFAHDDAADGGMADEEAGVRGQRAVQAVEVVGRGAPVPRHALLQRLERHPFDAGQHPHQVVPVGRRQRRDGEAAVATDDGGDTVER